jgi:uncharacterized protein (UPF0248 family)
MTTHPRIRKEDYNPIVSVAEGYNGSTVRIYARPVEIIQNQGKRIGKFQCVDIPYHRVTSLEEVVRAMEEDGIDFPLAVEVATGA